MQSKAFEEIHPLNIEIIKREMATCPIHGEYQTFRTVRGIGDCPKCAEEQWEKEKEENRRERDQAIAEAKIREVFKRSSVPKLFKGITFDDYTPDNPEAESVLNIMKQYVEAHDRVIKQGKSILLHGNTRTGKTMLGAAALNEYMQLGYTALYIECPDLINFVKNAWVKNPEESQDHLVNKFVKPDVVLIDDLPKGCLSERERQILWSVINRRIMNLKPTITTSLFDKDSLKKKVHEEISRRITFRGMGLHFNWEPYEEEGLF